MTPKPSPLDERWKLSSKEKPQPYELVLLKEDEFAKPIYGWWGGTSWEGLKVHSGIKYRFWKRYVSHA